MFFEHVNYSTNLTYIFLYLTVILLWVPKFKQISVWWLPAILTIFFGMLTNQLNLIGVTFISVLVVATYFFEQTKSYVLLHIFLGCVILFLGGGLATHTFPGFHNLKIIDNVLISQDGIPFTLYLNIDKTFVGIFIIAFTHRLISSRNELLSMIRQTIPRTLATILITMTSAIALGYIQFDPKMPENILLWSATNLLLVCLSEEALFRGFIQKNISLLFRQLRFGSLFSIAISSILFGLAHYAGGVKYVILATVAGAGYGWIYHKTKQIEASMLAHFLLNLTHILLFTYPALANAI